MVRKNFKLVIDLFDKKLILEVHIETSTTESFVKFLVLVSDIFFHLADILAPGPTLALLLREPDQHHGETLRVPQLRHDSCGTHGTRPLPGVNFINVLRACFSFVSAFFTKM